MVRNNENDYFSEDERLTVKCFVKDKPPFQGFPCKGSNICIPLHWECDGEEDCVGKYIFFSSSSFHIPPGCFSARWQHWMKKSVQWYVSFSFAGGFDESRCDTKHSHLKPTTESPTTKQAHKCKRNEFPCESKSVPVCLPVSWLCDGRTDCTDG